MKSAVGVANLVIFCRKSCFLSDFQGSVCPAVVDIRQLYLSPLSWCRRLLVSFVFDSCLSVFEADGLVSFHNYPRARRSSEWFEWLMKTSYEKSKRKFWKSFKSAFSIFEVEVSAKKKSCPIRKSLWSLAINRSARLSRKFSKKNCFSCFPSSHSLDSLDHSVQPQRRTVKFQCAWKRTWGLCGRDEIEAHILRRARKMCASISTRPRKPQVRFREQRAIFAFFTARLGWLRK